MALLSFSQAKAQENHTSLNNLTVLISSCDKYSGLWEGFFHSLFKQWPSLKTSDVNIPLLLVSNEKTFSDPRITTIATKASESWSDNMLDALDQVKTEYILVLLDDYFLTKFDRTRLMEVWTYIQKNKVAYAQLSGFDGRIVGGDGSKHLSDLPGARQKGKHEVYRTSIQACIWRVEDLRQILKKRESIWDFEVKGSIRSEGNPAPFLVLESDPVLENLNMVNGGHISSPSLEAAAKMGIPLPTGLPLDEEHKLKRWVKYTLKPWVGSLIESFSPALKDFLKNLLN